MKKIFFIAILAILAIFFACNKAEQQDSVPVTPPTVGQNDDEVPGNGPQGSEVVSFRSCDGCGTCCCRVTLLAPTGIPANTTFCSAAIPNSCGLPGCTCLLGNGTTCGSGTSSGNASVNQDLEIGNGDFKEWCQGGTTSEFVITNTSTGNASYRVTCGTNSEDIGPIASGTSVRVRKEANCDVSHCTY